MPAFALEGFTLSTSEAESVRRLLAATEAVPIRLVAFWEQHYFNNASGRALILQPAQACGYFYLKREIYERAEQLASEIKALLDLCLLLAKLKAHRLIYQVQLGESKLHSRREFMFVSDFFQQPKYGQAHLILNSHGDYSQDPHTLLNGNDEILYRGILLNGELYELVCASVDGMLSIPDAGRQILIEMVRASPAIAAPKLDAPAHVAKKRPFMSRKQLALTLGMAALLCSLLIAAATYGWPEWERWQVADYAGPSA
ncbi:hypothetical protein PWG14_16915 (plasmid) [Chromobacterium amazonense]|uniref:hypothetical protein n=1 Tax=Chromobacterium amazonense TaxID=1382803 RepID=UPI00237D6A08|nr:hypothetical protein [Chromobacterium amazonense]MDE1714212.1 hypothetical protein [Chromobacterium amazonense]